MSCWKCGASLEEIPQPLARLAECLACSAELHVCRMCEFRDLNVANQCREPIADEVKEKERANFCDYFQPRADAFTAQDDSEARKSQNELDVLFGGDVDAEGKSEGKSGNPLDDLFKS